MKEFDQHLLTISTTAETKLIIRQNTLLIHILHDTNSLEINFSITLHKILVSIGPRSRGGGVLSPKSYVDVPAGPRKSDYLYINFLPNFPPISIPFLKEKHPILIKLGAFYNNLPKILPIYVIWAPSSLMKTPPIAIPNFAKKCPKRQAHIRIPCQCENPPPPPGPR